MQNKINYQCRNELSYEICFDYKGHDYRIYYTGEEILLQRLSDNGNWWDTMGWEANVYLDELEGLIDEENNPEALALLEEILKTEN